MKLDRRTVRTILLIITFAVALFTAAQNLGAIYGAVRTVWGVFSVVITGLALAFVLNVPMKLFEERLLYGMSEDRRAPVRRLRRPLSIVGALVVTLGVVVILFAVLLPRLIDTVVVVAESLPAYVEKFIGWAEHVLERFNLESGELLDLSINWSQATKQFIDGLTSSMGDIIGTATNVGTSVAGALVDGCSAWSSPSTCSRKRSRSAPSPAAWRRISSPSGRPAASSPSPTWPPRPSPTSSPAS